MNVNLTMTMEELVELYKTELLPEWLHRRVEEKLEKIANRELYSTYKTATDTKTKEAARLKYIERKEISTDFRW